MRPTELGSLPHSSLTAFNIQQANRGESAS